MKERWTGALLTAFGGMCWGISGSVGQYLFTNEGMDSRWLVPVRLGLAGIVLLVYCALRYGKMTYQPWTNKKDALDLVIYGLLGVSCCQFFYFLTIQNSNAGTATILQNVSPVLILATECYIAKRIPVKREIFSVILALIGIWLIATHGTGSLEVSSLALISGILSAVCVTIYNCYPKVLLNKYPITLLQGWAFLLGGIVFSFVFDVFHMHYVPTLTGWLGVAFVVLVGNVLAFTTYMRGVKMIGAEKAILYSFFEPLTAAIITVLFMGTPFTMADFIGFVCIFGMLVMISKKEKIQNEEGEK